LRLAEKNNYYAERFSEIQGDKANDKISFANISKCESVREITRSAVAERPRDVSCH